MAILAFRKTEVQKILDHTLANPQFSPTLAHRANEKYWKDGAVADQFGLAGAGMVDMNKVGMYVLLVKDSGIYLMAGTNKVLPAEGRSTGSFVSYADGYDEDADYDAIVDAVGGDDFAEPLPFEMITTAMEDCNGDYIKFEVSAEEISIIPG